MLTSASTVRTGDSITMPSTAIITERLDSLEATLPEIPAKVLHLQRAVAAKTYDNYAAALGAVADSYKTFLGTAVTSGKTVTGQARAAGEQLVTTLTTGIKTVAGQANAQTKRVLEDRRRRGQGPHRRSDRRRRGRRGPPEHGHAVRGVDQGRARRAGQGAEDRRADAHEQVAADQDPPQGVLTHGAGRGSSRIPGPIPPTCTGAPGGTRTHTVRILRPLPLPIGLPGRRPSSVTAATGRPSAHRIGVSRQVRTGSAPRW